MQKLRLNVEELAVTSFTTETTPEARGTVHGALAAYSGSCPSPAWMEWMWRTTYKEPPQI